MNKREHIFLSIPSKPQIFILPKLGGIRIIFNEYFTKTLKIPLYIQSIILKSGPVRTQFVTNCNSVGFAHKKAPTMSFVERGSQPTSKRKTPGVTTTQPCMNTTKNPPPGDQGLAFQTHALQMTLLGPFYVRTQHCCSSLRIVSLQDLLVILS